MNGPSKSDYALGAWLQIKGATPSDWTVFMIFKCTRPRKCWPPHPLFLTPKTQTGKILEGWLAWTPPSCWCVAKGPWDLRCKERSTRSSRHHEQFNSACKSLHIAPKALTQELQISQHAESVSCVFMAHFLMWWIWPAPAKKRTFVSSVWWSIFMGGLVGCLPIVQRISQILKAKWLHCFLRVDLWLIENSAGNSHINKYPFRICCDFIRKLANKQYKIAILYMRQI